MPLAEADDKTIKGAIRNGSLERPRRARSSSRCRRRSLVRITDGTVRATAGKTEMKLDQPDGSGGKVTVVAGRTKITMNQDGDVSVSAAQNITIAANGDLSAARAQRLDQGRHGRLRRGQGTEGELMRAPRRR